MSGPLPRIRLDLDFIPSPLDDRPGLLIRDGRGYSDVMMVIPPPLIPCLECFDGERTELDLRAELVRITGELEVGDLAAQLTETLSTAGFLHDERYLEMREGRHQEFAEAPVRLPSHAGGAYPAEPEALRGTIREYMDGAGARAPQKLAGIAAPHVSPFGGVASYKAAYSALDAADGDKTFFILGTSHYGEPDRFGITRKPFETPFGRTHTDAEIINRLAAQPAAIVEDYCHAVEHSIEFQVVFLQYLFGPDIRIVPVLCGSFLRAEANQRPEDNDNVRRFFDELAEIAAKEGDRLRWILGIDMAHMGPRYGDPYPVRANEGMMLEVAERDRGRIERVNAADADGFWDLVQENRDDLKWCGSAPLYTFLKAVPEARGSLREYQHWNIDEQSVVSFGALTFTR